MKKKKIFPITLLCLLIFSFIFRTAFALSQSFSEFYTLKIAPIFRIPLSFITYPFPFSVFESIILIFALLVLVTVVSGVVHIIFKTNNYFKMYLKIIFYTVCISLIVFILSFSSAYSRKPIDENIGLEKAEMTKENIALALDKVIAETELLAKEIPHTPYRESRLKMSFDELKKEVLLSVNRANEKYNYLQNFSSPAKPIAFSIPLAYTGISGVYGFLTGEANINTAFSDYTLPFTMAHEYSHQRGIGNENEAEFSAFLICLESKNPYVRYSAYSQVAVTLSNLLYEYDTDLFYDALSRFPDLLYWDIVISAKNYEEFSKTALDEIASTVNDIYLVSNGDEGVISYSLSAELYVAYLLKGAN